MKTDRLLSQLPMQKVKSKRPAGIACFLIIFNFVFLILNSALATSSSPPDRMTYQGFLVDANGNALGLTVPKNYDVIFKIYDSQNGGALKWAEFQTVTADKGYFSVLLGEGTQNGSDAHGALSLVFNANDASDRFIQMTVKGIGANNSDVDILPRLQLLSSPYSFLAQNSVNSGNLVNSTNGQIVTVSGARVGINRAVPGSALDVNGTVTATAFSGNGSGLSSLDAGTITLGTLADGHLSGNVALLSSSQTFTGLKVFNGNVGIGTSTVSDGGLAIGSNTHINDNDIYLRGGTDHNHGIGWYGSSKNFAGVNPDGAVVYGNAGGILGTMSGGAKSVLKWNSSGQVGIGTTSPDADLDVGGYTGSGALRTVFARLSEGDSTGSGTFLGVRAWATQQSSYNGKSFSIEDTFYGALNNSIDFYRGGGATGGFIKFTAGDGTEAMTITSGGISTPGTITASGALYVDGWIYNKWGGSYLALDKDSDDYAYWSSDQRLKQNITTIPNALTAVKQLRGVTFHWNETGMKHLTRDIETKWKSASGKPEDNKKLWDEKRAEQSKKLNQTQVGFIAQEVERVFPDWVRTDKEGFKQIDMKHLDSVLVNAIHEQQSQIEAQQKQIEALTTANTTLEKRLSAIEKSLNNTLTAQSTANK